MKKMSKKLLMILPVIFITCGMLMAIPGPLGADNIPVTSGVIKELAFTGVDPIMPISGAAAAITGLILILISLRQRQYRKWKHSLGYYTKDEA